MTKKPRLSRDGLLAEIASLRAAGEELAELLGFIEYENDITAGPTEKARDSALSAWRKATARSRFTKVSS